MEPYENIPSSLERESADYLAKQAAEQDAADFGEAYDRSVENTHIFVQAAQYADMLSAESDPDWELDPDQLLKDLEERNIPIDWADDFTETFSQDEYNKRMYHLAERATNDQRIATAGASGIGAAVLAAITDPIGAVAELGVGKVASGGMTGLRVYRNSKRYGEALEAAGKAELTLAQRIRREGAAAVLTSTTVGSSQGLTNPDYDGTDFVIDAVAGAALGTLVPTAGALLNKQERAELFGSIYRGARRTHPELYGDDTLSAARVAGSVDGTEDTLYTGVFADRSKSAREALADLDDLGVLQPAVARQFRIDMHRHVSAQPSAEGRAALRALHSETVGVKDGGDSVNASGAIEKAKRRERVWSFETGKAIDDLLGEVEVNGKKLGWWARNMSIARRSEMEERLGRYMMGASDETHPSFSRAAQRLRKVLDDIADDSVKYGVKGAGRRVRDYFPRRIRHDIREFIRDINDRGRGATVEEPMEEVIYRAISEGFAAEKRTVDEAITRRVSKAYVRRLMGASDGPAGQVDRMTDLRMDYLEELLEESKLDAAEVDEIMEHLFPEGGVEDGAPSARLKSRLPMNMKAAITLDDGSELRVADFFDQNAFRVLQDYNREFAGHVSLAEQGFGDWREYRQLLDNLHGEGKLDDDGLRVGEKYLRSLMGRPIDPGEFTSGNKFARMLMDYNFLSLMGGVVIAQLTEVSKGLALTGFRAAVKQLPGLKATIRQAINGDMDNELAKQMAAFWGAGTHHFRSTAAHRVEDFNRDNRLGKMLGGLDKGMQYAKRLQTTVSGFGPVLDIEEIQFGKSMLQHLFDASHGSGLSKSMRARFRDYGLSNSDINKVTKHFKETAVGDNGVITDPKLPDMPEDVRWKFADAMSRATRHAIQEADVGAYPEFYHKQLGKLMAQFRGFTLAAYTRHTLHGAAKADAVTALGYMYGMAFAALGYVSYVHLNYANNPEMRKKMLTEENIAKMAFSRSADASIVPMLIDSFNQIVGNRQQFAMGRTTGSPMDVATGNPTYQSIKRLSSLGQAAAFAARPDKEMTQAHIRDIMTLIWMNRLPGLLNAQNYLAGKFPTEYEADNDNEE